MNHDEDFRALATAAMRCATGLLATLNADALEGVEIASRSGAKLVLEFGPLPAFSAVTLLLVEPEGRRYALGSLSVAKGSPS